MRFDGEALGLRFRAAIVADHAGQRIGGDELRRRALRADDGHAQRGGAVVVLAVERERDVGVIEIDAVVGAAGGEPGGGVELTLVLFESERTLTERLGDGAFRCFAFGDAGFAALASVAATSAVGVISALEGRVTDGAWNIMDRPPATIRPVAIKLRRNGRFPWFTTYDSFDGRYEVARSSAHGYRAAPLDVGGVEGS